jgi:hypothetical protein
MFFSSFTFIPFTYTIHLKLKYLTMYKKTTLILNDKVI